MGVMDGMVAIVTGAGSNMGEAGAELFAAEGATVIAVDIDAGTGGAVAARIGASFIRADVSKSAEVDALVAEVVARHGRLDVMYNNAGIARVTNLVDCTDEEFEAIIGVNLGGVFHGTRAAARVMAPRGKGAIINTASTNAIHGVPGMSLYSASKSAVVAFTRVVAAELAGSGVRVNAICPGVVPSMNLARQMGVTDEQIAALGAKQFMGRVGRPEEIARGALYLATDASSFVTGHALVIDGGMTAVGRDPV